MNNEEAIKVLKVHKLYNSANDNVKEAIDIAIKALENQSNSICIDKVPEPTMRTVIEGIFPIIKKKR